MHVEEEALQGGLPHVVVFLRSRQLFAVGAAKVVVGQNHSHANCWLFRGRVSCHVSPGLQVPRSDDSAIRYPEPMLAFIHLPFSYMQMTETIQVEKGVVYTQ